MFKLLTNLSCTRYACIMCRRRKRMSVQSVSVRNVVSESGRRLRVRLSRRVPVECRQRHLSGLGRVHCWPTHLPTVVHQHPRVVQVRLPTGLPADRRSLCRYSCHVRIMSFFESIDKIYIKQYAFNTNAHGRTVKNGQRLSVYISFDYSRLFLITVRSETRLYDNCLVGLYRTITTQLQ